MSETTAQDEKTTEKPAAKKAAASRTKKAAEPTVETALALIDKATAEPDSPEAAQVAEWLAAQAPADDEEPTSALTAILAVMRDVRAVGKHGRNADQNYAFRGVDDVMNALGPAMRRRGLVMLPQLRRQDVEKTVRQIQGNGVQKFSTSTQVEVAYRFYFAKGGPNDYVEAVVPGESIDTSDKATAKAMSVALRICMLQTFALPTYDEDPDQHNVEVESIPAVTPDEVQNACRWAANQLDLDSGFQTIRDTFSTRATAGVVVTTRGGDNLTVLEYIAYAEGHARTARAEATAQQQDSDAQGETRAQDDPAQNDARARTSVDAHPEVERRDTDNERQNTQRRVGATLEQERQERIAAQEAAQREDEARAASMPRESAQDRAVRQVIEEAKYQAEVLGVNADEHVAPILRVAGDEKSVKVGASTRDYLVGFRPAVIEKLRGFGDATAADAYARIGDGFPLSLDYVTNPQEPATAQ